MGLAEVLGQRLEITMAIDRNAEHLTLHPAVKALHEAIHLGRIGLGLAMLHLQLAAGVFKAISREAGSSVRPDVRDLEGERANRLFEEGDRTCGQLLVFDRQMHPAR